MADPDKDAGTGLERFFSRLDVLQLHAGHFALRRVQDVRDHRIPDELDLLVPEHTVPHNPGGPQLVAPVNDGHLCGVARQEERLFGGRVAAAHHNHRFASEEIAVTGGAGRNAVAQELALRFQTQHLR